jgi:hypothetical protein
MDDLIGMHEPDNDEWAKLSCNRGEPEGEAAPEMEDSHEAVDGPASLHSIAVLLGSRICYDVSKFKP